MSAMGQTDLLSKEGSLYYYNGQAYKYTELEPIYEQHTAALDLYLSGAFLTKNSNTNGIIALGLYGVTVTALIARSSASHDAFNTWNTIGRASFIGAFIMTSIALLQRLNGKKKLETALNIFNHHQIEQKGYDSRISVDLSQTPNGIGLVLNF